MQLNIYYARMNCQVSICKTLDATSKKPILISKLENAG